MFESPDQQWRELTAHYAEMWDEELLNLAADYNDLTDMAKQVLRDEMKKRGLGAPETPRPATHLTPPPIDPAPVERVAPPFFAPVSAEERLRIVRHYSELGNEELLELAADYENLTFAAQDVLREEMNKRGLAELEDGGEDETDTDSPRTLNPILDAAEERVQRLPSTNAWRVKVCDCQNREHGRQLAEMLSRAGIEPWLRSDSFGGYYMEVSADQADEAEAIVQQPIPQDIIDDSKTEVPEFVMPRCPKCGSEEPALLSAEPSNTWLCESCGNEWADPIPEANHA